MGRAPVSRTRRPQHQPSNQWEQTATSSLRGAIFSPMRVCRLVTRLQGSSLWRLPKRDKNMHSGRRQLELKSPELRKLEHHGPATANQRKKEKKHKSSCIHVPTSWSLTPLKIPGKSPKCLHFTSIFQLLGGCCNDTCLTIMCAAALVATKEAEHAVST